MGWELARDGWKVVKVGPHGAIEMVVVGAAALGAGTFRFESREVVGAVDAEATFGDVDALDEQVSAALDGEHDRQEAQERNERQDEGRKPKDRDARARERDGKHKRGCDEDDGKRVTPRGRWKLGWIERGEGHGGG